jgi:hypothetical protein
MKPLPALVLTICIANHPILPPYTPPGTVAGSMVESSLSRHRRWVGAGVIPAPSPRRRVIPRRLDIRRSFRSYRSVIHRLLDLCPAPPVSTRTVLPLPCSSTADFTSVLLGALLSVCGRLNHVADIRHAPVTNPAATDLTRLLKTFARSVVLVGGVMYPAASSVCPSVPTWHSFHLSRDDFGRQKPEAPSYPSPLARPIRPHL